MSFRENRSEARRHSCILDDSLDHVVAVARQKQFPIISTLHVLRTLSHVYVASIDEHLRSRLRHLDRDVAERLDLECRAEDQQEVNVG